VAGEPSQHDARSAVATDPPPIENANAPVGHAVRDTRRWVVPAVVAVLLASVFLRFLTTSPMWLDEAQTVSIANRSLPHLFSALRDDGSPPLYYLLLHFWMSLFGTSSFAIRSLSGIFAVLALPVMAVVARRFRLTDGSPWTAVLILATCPFAVRYATEARMYSLVLLLVLLALLTYERVWSVGNGASIAAAAVVTGALLLTHYWSLFLLAAAAIITVVASLRGVRRARRLLLPMAIGCVALVPWLPSFAYQARHTGAPWGSPPGVAAPLLSPGTWVGSGPGAALLRAAYYALLVVALVGYAEARGMTLRRPVRRRALLLLVLAIGTLLLGTIVSEVLTSSYSPRYSTIALAPVLLVVAAGVGALPARHRTAGLSIVCALGLAGCALIPGQLRTQAGQVATILKSAGPHDLVVFCPDQLGPAVHRLAPDAGTQVVYPTFGSSAMVDWVDYAKRNENADPIAFARDALRRAAGHTIWLVYDVGYPTLAGGCSSLVTSFTIARGRPVVALSPHSAFEKDTVAEFPARASS
jgi:mannosyltransferase